MQMKSWLVAPIVLSSLACASEIDSFTNRFEPLKDIAPLVHDRANGALDATLQELNESGCDEALLYKKLRVHFNSIHQKGKLVDYILHDPEFPRRKIKRDDSILRHHRVIDGQLIGRDSAAEGGFGIGSVVNFNGHLIGSDKFEHMFGQGFRYFDGYHQKRKRLRSVLGLGILKEKTLLGGNILATGVFSFADLVANFEGMRFWNHLLQRNPDVLGEDLGPIIACEDNRWVKVKPLDFKPFISAAVDEAYNCSTLATSRAAHNVRSEVAALGLTCPLDIEELQRSQKKYQVKLAGLGGKSLDEYLFNPWNKIRRIPFFWWP